MKRFAFRLMSHVGTLLTHRQRRFLLDRLGLARILGRFGANEIDEIVLPDGMIITINPLLHAHLARDGLLAYEVDLLKVIEEHLEPGHTFYDLGANVGVFSFIASRWVGEGGTVHAFEPEENNLACFRRTLRRSDPGNLILHGIAVGAEDGEMTFDRRGGAFSGRLVDAIDEVRGDSITVQVRSIDSLVNRGLRPPNVVKIDVEGGEGAVLEGMRRTLELHGPTVLCELHSFNTDGIRRTLAVLREAKYRCLTLTGDPVPEEGRASTMSDFILARPG